MNPLGRPALCKILGLAPDADALQIQRAYRRLAGQLHPDKNRDDPVAIERFLAVQDAYRKLLAMPRRDPAEPSNDSPPTPGRPPTSLFTRLKRRLAKLRRGRDLHTQLHLSPRDLDHGGRFSIRLTRREACPSCQDGSAGGPCSTCANQGSRLVTVTLELAIPKALPVGTVLRLRGQGDQPGRGGRPGDLLVTIES